MNVILIGAGRGIRLMPFTEKAPKSLTLVAGKRILDWTLDAFRQNGLDQFIYIGGYQIQEVRETYPNFRFVENKGWNSNNILFSLMCAREYMKQGFYATYTDTLFRPDAVAALKNSPFDLTLVMDSLWRQRYRFRTQHPESDGEKIVARGDLVSRVSRTIPPEEASGEFTGLMRLTPEGAARFLDFFDGLYAKFSDDGVMADDRPFRMAYLIHQFGLMVQAGIKVHCVRVPGEYHEIDTIEDYHLASKEWGNVPKETP